MCSSDLTGPNGTTRLEPKVMQVLVCLAERAGQVVSKDRLFQAAWADTAVTDDVLTRAISELRRLFDDDPKQPWVIETIPKGGYRLIAPVNGPQAAESVPNAVVTADPRPNRVLVATLSSAVVIAVAAGWFFRPGREVKTPASPQLVSLTMLRGMRTIDSASASSASAPIAPRAYRIQAR